MADLQRVQQALQSLAASTGARDLNARANGDLVEIHGTVRSIAEKQNIMRAVTQAAGDVGIKNLIHVAADTGQQQNQLGRGGPAIGMSQASETTWSTSMRTHRVAKGETLSHIAQRYYGKASEYNRIFDANRDQLSDPDKVREGMELKIPELTMTRKRIVDNRNRPAQPEPGEDPALEKPPSRREQGTRPTPVTNAKKR